MFRTRRPESVAQHGTVWYGPHDVLHLGGWSISSPLAYVGAALPAVHDTGSELEPSVIDPSLLVTEPSGDKPTAALSYVDLSPEHRGDFLQWMSQSELPADSPSWAVRLQLAGLERRLLFDHLHSDLSYEVGPILARLKALLRITTEPDIRRAMVQLMTVAVGDLPTSSKESPPDLDQEMSAFAPESCQVILGWYVAASKPIPGPTLVQAVRALAGTSLPTDAYTCPGEFDQLLAVRLEEAGLTRGPGDAAVDKTTIEVEPLSPSFKLDITVSLRCLADADLESFMSACASVASACGPELASFARWVRRDVVDESTSARALLLPEELGGQQTDAVPELRDLMETACARSDTASLDISDIAAVWPLADDIEADPAAQADLARYLELIGFGLVPDARFGDPLLPGEVVCFRAPEPPSPTENLLSQLEALRMAWSLIVADDVVTDAEVWRLEDRLNADHMDTTPDGVRVLATHAWMKLRSDHGFDRTVAAEPPSHGRLSTLSAADRRSLARLLVALVCSDARIVEAEVTALHDAFGKLGISGETVDSLIKSFTGLETNSVLILEAQGRVPDRSTRASSAVEFLAAIESVEKESVDSSPAVHAGDERVAVTSTSPLVGTSLLPEVSTQVLIRLCELDDPRVEDAAQIARSVGAMWGQISEEINEAAIDLTGDLALDEEDGRIVLDLSVIERLVS